ncbi:type II toxin-antitoxin system RelE/ParE family toxin [Hydrogenovibrio halophilus]|uniref:type II toxin-antitoxin system RelE/ParE family toxin n=2 Tax=Hydrogenovibrio TaxID=28884 RepID=UPI0003639A59|nr:type II toxin-antitoxin system RelE/ParE family toxin [Hydrogenovibrio halophilus]
MKQKIILSKIEGQDTQSRIIKRPSPDGYATPLALVILNLKITWNPCYHANMIVSFKNKAVEDVFNGRASKEARKTCPQTIWKIAARKLEQLDSVVALDELKIPPGNRLEALSGDRQGQYSIRINGQFRICFKWNDSGPDEVEIVDYH